MSGERVSALREISRANIDRFVSELELDGVTVVPYPSYDSWLDHCFVLSQIRSLCAGACLILLVLCGRLKKLWVDGGGWLWSIGLGFAHDALTGEGDYA